jgi:hypothetical protein
MIKIWSARYADCTGWAPAEGVNQTTIEATIPANIRHRPQRCFLNMMPLTFHKSGQKKEVLAPGRLFDFDPQFV